MSLDEHSRRNVLRLTSGALGLSALGGLAAAQGGDGANAAQNQATGETVAMATSNNKSYYRAPFLWIDQGTTVTWNVESGSHSTTAYSKKNNKPQRIPDGASSWDSGILSQQGKTFDHTFSKAGVYDYYCTPHESLGMVGRVVVGAPNLSKEPAMQDPQQSIPKAAQQVLSDFNTLTKTMFGSQG
ncbi:MAG: plastocyanin/azurin family copper-binding protein [Salinigranum sp.]